MTTTKAILRWTANDVNDDDAYTYDDDYHCYYDDESYFFRYQIMRNCWKEEPDDRPSFEQLRHELKRMANQHKVIYRNVILSVEYLSCNVFKNLVFYFLIYSSVIFRSQKVVNVKDYDTKRYENVEDLMS